MEIILGSASPRRKEIMGYFNLPFMVVASDFDEESIVFEGDPKKYVITLAEKKGEVLADKYPDKLIITADTVVYQNGQIFNKPANPDEAFKALTQLAGRWHSVWTAISVGYQGKRVSDAEEARVLFHPITPLQAHKYQQAVGSSDKAGGYAIQGVGNLIIQKIEGDYTSVKGLPLTVLQKLLREFGIDLWSYL